MLGVLPGRISRNECSIPRDLILEKRDTHTSPVILPGTYSPYATNYPVLRPPWHCDPWLFLGFLRQLDSRVYDSVFGNSVVDGVRTMDKYR